MEYLLGLLLGFVLGACSMGAIMEWHQKQKDKETPPAGA